MSVVEGIASVKNAKGKVKASGMRQFVLCFLLFMPGLLKHLSGAIWGALNQQC